MAILYCECGHRIWSEFWWREPKHVLLFFDDLETSETYGEQMTHCPGCNRQLRRGILKPENDKYSSGMPRRRETV